MPNLLFQALTVASDIIIFIFVGYYLLRLRSKERELSKKETNIDTSYHQVVDNALNRERKILDDATHEADQIITDAKYINQASKQSIDQALSKMITDIQNQTIATAQEFTKTYETSLKQIADSSLSNFQNVTGSLAQDLQKQVKEFRETILPSLEKEIEEYKQARLKQAEQTISRVIQEATSEILNKSISIEDHQKLVIDSLEKAKGEGAFD